MLRWIGRPESATAQVFARSVEIARLGFSDMDALHLAFAEHLKTDYFVTVDDEILSRSKKGYLRVKLLDVVDVIKELGL